MIKFVNQVPSIYTSASRDFQYLSWLINIVLNSVKHNVDGLYNLPNISSDSKVSELLALTLGFKIKRNYDQKQLVALVATLPLILKYKGTITAVQIAAYALVKASGALGDAECEVEGAELVVTLPSGLVDIALFLDLLAYILPAGMTCRIDRKPIIDRELDDINVKYYDNLHKMFVNDFSIVNSYNNVNAKPYLSTLFDVDDPATSDIETLTSANYSTANLNKIGENTYILNAGLLDNAVIPVLYNNITPSGDSQTRQRALYSAEADGRNK
jgi:hypothetical protein